MCTCTRVRVQRKASGAAHAAFVPTGMARLLEGVCQALPRHNLIVADFDSLPPPSVDDQSQARGECTDTQPPLRRQAQGRAGG